MSAEQKRTFPKRTAQIAITLAGIALVTVVGAKIMRPTPAQTFDGKRALRLIETQVDFGPRIPGSKAHTQTAEWIKAELAKAGAELSVEPHDVTAPNGKPVTVLNIFGRYGSQFKKRILITAHWDTRPWADQEATDKDQPGPGANDGGSGVAVLLEIARLLKDRELKIGVDLGFWDLEDMGNSGSATSYCIGTQLWAKFPHRVYSSDSFGINLDMVGDPDAVFPQEGYSRIYAPEVLAKLQNAAKLAGSERYFPLEDAPNIIDDHYFMNTLGGIKSIDIIHLKPPKYFPDTWHTRQDTPKRISPQTLKAVGDTLMKLIEVENAPANP